MALYADQGSLGVGGGGESRLSILNVSIHLLMSFICCATCVCMEEGVILSFLKFQSVEGLCKGF